MRFLLDTNVVIGLLNGHEGILDRLRQHAPDDFGLSAIVAHEMTPDYPGTSGRSWP